MPNEFQPIDSDEQLQFETAEPVSSDATVEATSCSICHRPIVSQYYALRQMVLCPTCRALAEAPPAGTASSRALKATLYGVGAAVLGSIIWAVIRLGAHVQIGLVAVLVGFMVGKAVRKGSGGRGGRGYQVLAVALTYFCIAGNYVPDVLQGLRDAYQKHHPAAVSSTATGKKPISPGKAAIGLVVLVVGVGAISLTAPVLIGISNPISLLIQGIAIWEAWKLTKRFVPPITGPYQLNTVGEAPSLPPPIPPPIQRVRA